MVLLLTSCNSEIMVGDNAQESAEQTETTLGEDTQTATSESQVQLTFDSTLVGKSFASGDYEYTIQEDGTVFISGYTGDEKILTIPLELDNYMVTGIADSAFSGTHCIETLVVPGQIKSIGDEAFNYCTGLSSVTLEEGVESIGERAFFCSDTPLAELKIADSVYKMGKDAFGGRNVSKEINGLEYIGRIVVDFADSFDGHITFKENTIGIADYALEKQLTGGQWNRRYLEILDDTIEFPSGLMYIGNRAFLDQNKVKNYKIPTSVCEIGAHAMLFWEVNNDIVKYSDDGKIYGTEGSIAEQYAEAHGLNFVIVSE